MTPYVVSFDPLSERLALAEVRREGTVSRVLASGVAVVTWSPTRVPVFVRHRFAAEVESDANRDAVVAAALPLARGAPADRRFSVQTRVLSGAFHPRDVNEPVAAGAGAQIDVRNPEYVVSVVVAADRAYMGLSPVSDNLSPWAGGERRFARDPDSVSRAELKLLEALEVFGVSLPARGVALDLGAAPGGWTRVLLAHGLDVVAVDPAALHPSLAGRARHERVRAEAFLRRAGRYDVLVNDMRMDARDSARLSAAFAPKLHGVGIVTLKLPRRDVPRVLAESLRTLRAAYEVTGVRQLFHNRSEVTVALRAERSR